MDDSTRHWKVIALGVVVAVIFIFWLGVGYGQQWGAQQWGPFSDWLVGLLTFGAVVVALRESLKAQHSRLIDHELARRRENLDALANLWAALLVMNTPSLKLVSFFRDLPTTFNPNFPRSGSDPTTSPPLAEEVGDVYGAYITKWIETVEPRIFVALALLENTPVGEVVKQFQLMLRDYTTNELPKLSEALGHWRRPDVGPVSEAWGKIIGSRQAHLDVARKHFSLDLKDVEAAVRRR